MNSRIPALAPVRVLIVEDSPTESAVIRRAIEAAPDLRVVGQARDGQEGLEMLHSLEPDVVCTDFFMPRMDGLAFVERAMVERPCPIVVLSVGVQPYQSDNIFRMLSAGAIDVMPKPAHGLNDQQGLAAAGLQKKLRQLARIGAARVRSRWVQAYTRLPIQPTFHRPTTPARTASARTPSRPGWSPALFVIGASTGGPQALERIVAALPADLSCPVVCVQHISTGFIGGMVRWLDTLSPLQVRLWEPGSGDLAPGSLYLAPDGCNLEIDAQGRGLAVPLSAGEAFPCIDALFTSAAAAHGDRCVGILLSGMGMDGAVGLRAIHYAGGVTIAQEPATAVVDSMPRSAIESGSAQRVLPPNEIGPEMVALARGR